MTENLLKENYKATLKVLSGPYKESEYEVNLNVSNIVFEDLFSNVYDYVLSSRVFYETISKQEYDSLKANSKVIKNTNDTSTIIKYKLIFLQDAGNIQSINIYGTSVYFTGRNYGTRRNGDNYLFSITDLPVNIATIQEDTLFSIEINIELITRPITGSFILNEKQIDYTVTVTNIQLNDSRLELNDGDVTGYITDNYKIMLNINYIENYNNGIIKPFNKILISKSIDETRYAKLLIELSEPISLTYNKETYEREVLDLTNIVHTIRI